MNKQEYLNALEFAWGIIAHAFGSWDRADPQWVKAAKLFRDEYYFKALNDWMATGNKDPVEYMKNYYENRIK